MRGIYKMNDIIIFKKTIITRLKELETFIINDGKGIEMGRSPEWIKKQFKVTIENIFNKN